MSQKVERNGRQRLGAVSGVRLPKGRCVPEPDVDSWRMSLTPANIDAVRIAMPQ